MDCSFYIRFFSGVGEGGGEERFACVGRKM